MVLMISRLARYAARHIVANPRARDLASRAAKGIADEAKVVAKEEDKARAAGRSVRRLAKRLRASGDTRDDTVPDDKE